MGSRDGLGWMWKISPTRGFDPQAVQPVATLYRRLGGPQGRSGWMWKISPTRGFDPQTVQPVATLYRRPGGPQGRSWMDAENLSPIRGFDPRIVQPVAQSLYRLSYPDPHKSETTVHKHLTKPRHFLDILVSSCTGRVSGQLQWRFSEDEDKDEDEGIQMAAARFIFLTRRVSM